MAQVNGEWQHSTPHRSNTPPPITNVGLNDVLYLIIKWQLAQNETPLTTNETN